MASLKEDMIEVLKDTDFVKNYVGTTQLGEFKYTHGGSVQPGLEYHIHYTNDKKEVFMLGGALTRNSKIIEKNDNKSLFSTYNKLIASNKEVYPKKYTPLRSESDYRIGSFRRYFTQKANNLNGELFEISKESYDGQNTLFRYFQIIWIIGGKKIEVATRNLGNILSYSSRRGNKQLKKILRPLQFWIPPENSPEEIKEKLNRRKII